MRAPCCLSTPLYTFFVLYVIHMKSKESGQLILPRTSYSWCDIFREGVFNILTHNLTFSECISHLSNHSIYFAYRLRMPGALSQFPTNSCYVRNLSYVLEQYQKTSLCSTYRVASGSVVGSETMVETGRSRLRLPLGHCIILSNFLNASSGTMGLELTQPLPEMSARRYFW
jgi:hypothetical protein